MASRRASARPVVKAAIYARVSSDDGRQTTVNQLQQLRELVTARQFEIVREYLDEEAGACASRPSFLALLRDARLRRFRVLLITDLDRLTREGAAAGFGYLAELDRFGVSVVSLGQSWLDYDPAVDEDPELREMRSIQTAIALTWAALERQKISRRTKAGLEVPFTGPRTLAVSGCDQTSDQPSNRLPVAGPPFAPFLICPASATRRIRN